MFIKPWTFFFFCHWMQIRCCRHFMRENFSITFSVPNSLFHSRLYVCMSACKYSFPLSNVYSNTFLNNLKVLSLSRCRWTIFFLLNFNFFFTQFQFNFRRANTTCTAPHRVVVSVSFVLVSLLFFVCYRSRALWIIFPASFSKNGGVGWVVRKSAGAKIKTKKQKNSKIEIERHLRTVFGFNFILCCAITSISGWTKTNLSEERNGNN